MSDCKPKEKSDFRNVDLTSITNIINIITGVFRLAQKPATPIPPPLLLIGKNLRPGMSARNLAARQITRREENGEVMGNVFADGDNKAALGVVSDSQEIINEIQTNGLVEVAGDIGSVFVNVTGTAGGLPVIAAGSNISPYFLKGGLR